MPSERIRRPGADWIDHLGSVLDTRDEIHPHIARDFDIVCSQWICVIERRSTAPPLVGAVDVKDFGTLVVMVGIIQALV